MLLRIGQVIYYKTSCSFFLFASGHIKASVCNFMCSSNDALTMANIKYVRYYVLRVQHEWGEMMQHKHVYFVDRLLWIFFDAVS